MVRRAPTADVAILLVTFTLTVFVDLIVAVNIGVILATLHFLRRMASSVEVQQVDEQQLGKEISVQGLKLPLGVLVYSVEAHSSSAQWRTSSAPWRARTPSRAY